MSSSKESASASSGGSDDPLVMSIKSLPDYQVNPNESLPDYQVNPNGSYRMRRTSAPASRFSDNCSIFSRSHPRPLSVTYKTERTTTGLFKKKTTILDCGSFIKDNG